MCYIIYTDGACSENPGAGAFSFVIKEDKNIKYERAVYFGPKTTNNRMELMAVVEAIICFNAMYPGKEAIVRSDSTYVVEGYNRWSKHWLENNWKKSDNKPVANQDLWKTILHQDPCFKLVWVPGHNNEPGNERANFLAQNTLKTKINHELFQ